MADARLFDWRVLRAVALVFLAFKLALLVVARPFMDETYYFLWGQHPELSYFDHPPLVGWTEGLAALAFGWTIVGLRAAVTLTLVGDLAVLYLFARLHKGADWAEAFWPTATVFLATPIFFGLTNVALPDHLLVLFVLLALYGFECFRAGLEAGSPRWRFLYLTALAIGFATLSKYTGALLGLALALLVVATPRLRPLLRSPHPYLAGLVAMGLQVPVLIWNAGHDFASLGFVVGGRSGLHDWSSLSGVGGFVSGAVAVLSPFLLWPLVRFATGRADGWGFGRLVLWVSTLGFLAASLFTNILIHWNVIAYVAALPFLHPYLRGRFAVGAHIVYGAVAAAIIAVNFTLLPVMALISHADQASAWSYGWSDVAAKIGEIRVKEPVDFVAATDYALASPLAFALKDRDVTSLSAGREAFDDWFDPNAHRGETALIIADSWRPLSEEIRHGFDRIDELATVDVRQWGWIVDRYTIYAGHDFHGVPAGDGGSIQK